MILYFDIILLEGLCVFLYECIESLIYVLNLLKTAHLHMQQLELYYHSFRVEFVSTIHYLLDLFFPSTTP